MSKLYPMYSGFITSVDLGYESYEKLFILLLILCVAFVVF